MKILLLTIGIAGSAGGAGYFYLQTAHEPHAVMAFINAYAEYSEAADLLESLSNAPGAGGNAARQTLHKELTNTLDVEQPEAVRLQSATVALEALTEVKRSVDRAQSSSAEVYRLIDVTEKMAQGLQGTENIERTAYIISLMKTRQEAAARMASVLSATNDETERILRTLIEEKGVISAEHVTAINAVTAEAEQRFETVNGLSRELSAVREELLVRYQEFAEDAL